VDEWKINFLLFFFIFFYESVDLYPDTYIYLVMGDTQLYGISQMHPYVIRMMSIPPTIKSTNKHRQLGASKNSHTHPYL